MVPLPLPPPALSVSQDSFVVIVQEVDELMLKVSLLPVKAAIERLSGREDKVGGGPLLFLQADKQPRISNKRVICIRSEIPLIIWQDLIDNNIGNWS